MRIAYYDNLRLLLMMLVVFGHLIEKMNEALYAEYFIIYSSHMPLFILLSGYFSKVLVSSEDFWRLTQLLLVPYVLLELFYGVTDSLLYGKSLTLSLAQPNWGMWYLLSLFTWRLLLGVVEQYRYALILLVIIGLLIGYDSSVGSTLSLSRTITFFPFFYGGYLLARHGYALSKLSSYRSYGVSILILFVIVVYVADPNMDLRWFYGKLAYVRLDEPIWGALVRLGIYALAIIIGVSILTLVPERRFSFTHRGSKTMNIYVWHFIFLDILISSGFYKSHAALLSEHHMMALLSFMLLSVVIVAILSSGLIERYLSLHRLSFVRYLRR